MIGIGPYSIGVLVAFAAILIAWVAAHLMARRQPDAPLKMADRMVLDAVLLGLVAARLGYLVQWWDEYAQAPWAIVSIGDGGYVWWVGVLAALALVWWRTRSARSALRRPIVAGIGAGVLSWFAAGAALGLVQRNAPPLPDLQLTTFDARPVALSSYLGRPVVLNLWSSWCPPCRREMPMFEQAQAEFPHLDFVMINQGEDAAIAQRFLTQENLVFEHMLLDPSSQAMASMGTRALPTTLFFDAQGRLVASHLGELTMASLKDTVQRRLPPSSHPVTDKE